MKTLVVASGKGGAGKTTISALFAIFASQDSSVVVVDCDVEASNLPLALGAEITSRELFGGGEKAEVDVSLCAGCGDCLANCRFDAIAITASGSASVDPWRCEGCGVCATVCPFGAIKMEPQRAGHLYVGRSVTGPIVFGRLDPGHDLSGKLVSTARERAETLAKDTHADFILVDGPPGIGCPVIASITGAHGILAVTEPTLSGEHDLLRLIELSRQMRIPIKVALNKSDLSSFGADRIRETCQREGLELIGEIPFDEGLASEMSRLAEGGELVLDMTGVSGLSTIRSLWDRVGTWISEWEESPARTLG